MSVPPRYHAFLLRLWAVGSDEAPEWHASLQEIHDSQRHSFATLPDLVRFVEALTRPPQPQPDVSPLPPRPDYP